MLFYILLQFCVLIFSITIHEFFHGLVAYRLGDPTAKYAGRLTLNPLAHIDPFGTIFLPLVLVALHLPPIGWARPVPVNFSNLKNPKKDMLWVGLSGPCANLLLAIFLSLLLKFIPASYQALLGQILLLGVIINVVLAVFNLIPIPPLDGSRIITALMPWNFVRFYLRLEPYGFLIIIILAYTGILRKSVYLLALLIIKFLGISIPIF